MINLNKKIMRMRFNRAAHKYQKAAILQREIADRLLSRLQLIKIAPGRILDFGARNGEGSEKLRERYPKSKVFAYDCSEKMLRQHRRRWFKSNAKICGEYTDLPFASGSFDLIFSNLSLHWINEPARTLQEFFRILAPNGLLLFSTVGPDTLRELRSVTTHVHAFADMHDIGDALLKTGFTDPVMDMEYLTLHYDSVSRLIADLKETGTTNAREDALRGLMGRGRWQKLLDEYHQRWQLSDGRIPATIEIIYGHGWKPTYSEQVDSAGEIRIPIGAIQRR